MRIDYIRGSPKVATVDTMFRSNWLSWYGHEMSITKLRKFKIAKSMDITVEDDQRKKSGPINDKARKRVSRGRGGCVFVIFF